MKHSFEEVMRIDDRLCQLAAYEVTGGKMKLATSLEDIMEQQDEIADKFNEFKDLIQKGECTYNFIEQTVLAKNGPFPKSELNFDDPNLFQRIREMDTADKLAEKESQINKDAISLVNRMLDSFNSCDCPDCRDRADEVRNTTIFDKFKKPNNPNNPPTNPKRKNNKKKE
jgi:hypothetical protein